MDQRLPYYMAYPMPLLYDDDRMERRDFEYMKSMYPNTAKQILPFVEDECDRVEYEGSMMYDEYPDQLQLQLMCGRVYRKVKDMDLDYEMPNDIPEEEAMEAQQFGRRRKDDEWLRDLIQVMLFQELYKRRCDHRRCRQRYY